MRLRFYFLYAVDHEPFRLACGLILRQFQSEFAGSVFQAVVAVKNVQLRTLPAACHLQLAAALNLRQYNGLVQQFMS